MKRAVVIQHVSFEDLGSLEPILRAEEFNIELLQAGVSDLTRADTPSADLLIVLGGPIGAYEQTEYPFLKEEIRLIAKRIDAGSPILGICLGAQLMAAAMGATVPGGKNGKEIGWSAITPVENTMPSNLLAPLFESDVRVLHWHGDTFDIPAGARHLASSKQYANQAFSLEQFGLALQFHAEVTADPLERWYIGHAAELAQAGIAVSQLRRDGRQYAPQLESSAAAMWKKWLRAAL